MVELVSLGELLIDFFPAELKTKLEDVSAFMPKPGGAPANVAVAASKLGIPSAFIGKVGQDPFGEKLISILAEQGVETKGIVIDHDFRTTLAFISMPDENTYECTFYRNPGADQLLKPGELDSDLIEGAKVFHCGSLSLAGEPIRSAHYAALEMVRKAGGTISFDMNYRPTLWVDKSKAVEESWEMVRHADILKVNEVEVELLTNTKDLEKAAGILLNEGPKLVAITLGQFGSHYFAACGSGFVPPFEVVAADATGCGDGFIAGLISQLIRMKDWKN